MNIQRFHIEVKERLDKATSSSYPELLVEQVDLFINNAIGKLVKTRYGRNNIYKAGVEEIQKRTDDLRTLVVTNFPAITTVTTESNTYKASLSTIYSNEALTTPSTDLYWFFLNGRARTVKTGCASNYHQIRIYSHDDIDNIRVHPFKKSTFTEVVGYFENGDLYLLTDGTFTIDKVKLSYIKKPAEVKYGTLYPTPTANVECDLPEQIHTEIVDLTVLLLLENLESMRTQGFAQLKAATEE
jgi:hypothetical protein